MKVLDNLEMVNNVKAYLLVDRGEGMGKHPVGGRLTPEGFPNNHETMSHNHHLVDLQRTEQLRTYTEDYN